MKINNRKKFFAAAIATFSIGLLYSIFFEKYFFEVKTFFIGNKDSDKKLKLLLLTDLHFKNNLDPADRKLAKKINLLQPDLILIAGDLVDEDGMYAPAKEFFNLLNKAIPKVGILGNHDHKNRIGRQTYKQLYTHNNGTLLINESKVFEISGHRLMVTGLDDFIEGHPSFSKAFEDVGKEENHLLLIHSPLQQEGFLRRVKNVNRMLPDEKKINIRYIFAGHNHGGQVCFWGYTPILPKLAGKYLKGWYNKQPPYLYVSKGFGTSTLPIRFGARSEATLFYLSV